MRLDTQAPEAPGTSAAIELKAERFDLITRVLGCESDVARARLLNVDRKTISRAREGVIGEEFIAKTIATMQRHQTELAALNITTAFEEVFSVVAKAA